MTTATVMPPRDRLSVWVRPRIAVVDMDSPVIWISATVLRCDDVATGPNDDSGLRGTLRTHSEEGRVMDGDSKTNVIAQRTSQRLQH